MATYDTSNQPPPFEDVNLFTANPALARAVSSFGAAAQTEGLATYGRWAGAAETIAQGRLANANPPRLVAVDARGDRRDEVLFHPAYHYFMTEGFAHGLHCSGFQPGGVPAGGGAQVARSAKVNMLSQVEAGHVCPLTMTHASIPALADAAADNPAAERWLSRIFSRDYDSRFAPAAEKTGVTLGMGMTENQGGTDVRSNDTTARAADGAYVIEGQKWFMSAPMCDAFLILAQAKGGLTCFILPRFDEDGRRNGLEFQRLKDKLGNRSNASSEVVFNKARAFCLGEEGRGVPTIIRMVTQTRLDCAASAAGIAFQALAQAIHHARHRRVFQKRLVDQPLMQSVLGDMALDVMAATAAATRLAASFDRADTHEAEAAYRRILTPAVKYWACKLPPRVAVEAMECLGGNGYIEDFPLALIYREAPLNGIWEGPGNVMALDLLRAAFREPDAVEQVIGGLVAATNGHDAARKTAGDIASALKAGEGRARTAAEKLALLAAFAAMVEAGDPFAEHFAEVRLGGDYGASYGTGIDGGGEALIEAAMPGR
ncbi:MAG: acyl-CoA dehydrogenase family protein [Flavobacteriaceae bacterium]